MYIRYNDEYHIRQNPPGPMPWHNAAPIFTRKCILSLIIIAPVKIDAIIIGEAVSAKNTYKTSNRTAAGGKTITDDVEINR